MVHLEDYAIQFKFPLLMDLQILIRRFVRSRWLKVDRRRDMPSFELILMGL